MAFPFPIALLQPSTLLSTSRCVSFCCPPCLSTPASLSWFPICFKVNTHVHMQPSQLPSALQEEDAALLPESGSPYLTEHSPDLPVSEDLTASLSCRHPTVLKHFVLTHRWDSQKPERSQITYCSSSEPQGLDPEGWSWKKISIFKLENDGRREILIHERRVIFMEKLPHCVQCLPSPEVTNNDKLLTFSSWTQDDGDGTLTELTTHLKWGAAGGNTGLLWFCIKTKL